MRDIVLQDSTFKQLSDFVYEKTGIFVPPSKKYLFENRLINLIKEKNFKGFDEYLYYIKYNSNGRDLSRLFDAITTNETYFFREPQQMDVFIDEIVPRVVQGRTKDIRIWSAACSTGEEPYTLAMMLMEKRGDVRADILASDISDKALESARRATYNSYSIRNVPELYLKKYFRINGQDYELIRPVKAMVRFKNINLIDEKEVGKINSMDVIFCRNVLIYFGDKAKQQTVSLLYDCLKPGGFLFIGSSESLHNITRAFRPMTINRVIVYQKV
jgi:chemotaxis protein methyltransferase CheR